MCPVLQDVDRHQPDDRLVRGEGELAPELEEQGGGRGQGDQEGGGPRPGAVEEGGPERRARRERLRKRRGPAGKRQLPVRSGVWRSAQGGSDPSWSRNTR